MDVLLFAMCMTARSCLGMHADQGCVCVCLYVEDIEGSCVCVHMWLASDMVSYMFSIVRGLLVFCLTFGSPEI